MEEILIKDDEAFSVQDGKLVRLGRAQNLKRIVGNVFKAESGPTYVIVNDLQILTLSKDSYPMRIVYPETNMPQNICRFRNDFNAAYKCKEDEKSKRLYKHYDSLTSSFSTEELNDLMENAVVLANNPNVALYRKDSAGNYIEQDDIVKLPFDEAPAFFYHGGLYGKTEQLQYALLPLVPLIMMPRYIVFWGGRNNLFALVKQKDNIEVKLLGALQQYFETPHGMIVDVEERFMESSVLYHFGEQNLERIFSYTYDEDYNLDTATGKIKFETKNGGRFYAFKRGHYMQI